MKTSLIILFLNLIAFTSFSQNLPNFFKIELKDSSDFRKAEKEVIIAANYLLETSPYEHKRGEAHQFLFRWMEGTPHYSFGLDETADKIYNMNSNLMGVYLAAMAKFTLEHKDLVDSKDVIKVATIRQIIAYCQDPANNVPINGALKKMIKAYEKGELEDYLAISKTK